MEMLNLEDFFTAQIEERAKTRKKENAKDWTR